jgi:hypothetical protein
MSSIVNFKCNECPICFKQNLLWHPKPKKSQIEVFICKHFTCKDCFDKLNESTFSCPVCRNEGQQYKDSFSSSDVKKWVTISQWYYHWEKYMDWNQEGLRRSNYGKIYFGLIDDIKKFISEEKERKKKELVEERRNQLRQKRLEERENSICKLCQTKCTSLIQLKKHINSKNCLKKQRSNNLKSH